jgi:hypothetical protein
MEAALTESTTLSQKSEREYVTLRESLKSMAESWKSDAEGIRMEMQKREDKVRQESEEIGRKYTKLLEDIQTVKGDKKSIELLRAKDTNLGKEVEEAFLEQISTLRKEVETSSKESDEAVQTSKCVFPFSPSCISQFCHFFFLQGIGTRAESITTTYAVGRSKCLWLMIPNFHSMMGF